jgi:PKD repeat protein
MPSRGSHVGLPGSEGNAAGSRGSSPVLAGPLGNADIAACNPVPPGSLATCNLTYHNGSVMHTNTTHLVFWAPTGHSFPAGYEALLERYLTDVAHDSGDVTYPYSVQQEWSNATSSCVMNYGAVAPTAAFTDSPSSPHALDTVSFDGASSHSNDAGGSIVSYSWDFGDGTTGSGAAPTHAYAQSRTYTVKLTVEDSAGVTASTTHDVVVVTRATTLAYTGASSGDYSDAVTLSGTLTDVSSSNGIGNEQVTFTIGVRDTCSATTDISGNASCSITPTQTGSQTIVAKFAGDTDYVASNTSQPFSLTSEETTMAYTVPTTILAGASGATLTATLVEDGSGDNDPDGGSPGPAPAQTVKLSLGTQMCTGTSDSTGKVSCTIPTVTVPLGPQTVGAAFTGNAYYSASSASTTAIVFAFPSRGAFTLGDKTVEAATPGVTGVTWWGDTWSTLNRLSGGTAPPSDKGFAGVVSLPTTTPPAACGSAWATTGGNSLPPTSGVPSYMGTLVTSKVKRTGQGIAGDTVSIVVVKVDPGYGPSPMNHGTGVVVATYC